MFNKWFGNSSRTPQQAEDASESYDATVQKYPPPESTLYSDTSTSSRADDPVSDCNARQSTEPLPRSSGSIPSPREDQVNSLRREHSTRERRDTITQVSGQQERYVVERSASVAPTLPAVEQSDTSVPADEAPTGERDVSLPDDDALQAWEDLRVRHSSLVNRRVDKTTSLEAVRRQRAKVRTQEADLISSVASLVNIEAGSELRAQLAALEAEQHEQDLLEKACESIEDDIIDEEWQVGQIEDRFYHPTQEQLDTAGVPGMPLLYHREIDDDEGSGSVTSILQLRADLSPEAQQYLSFLGDRHLLYDKLGALRTEQGALEDERLTRDIHGLSLDDDSLDFLAHFDVEHKDLMSQLAHIDEVLEELGMSAPCREVTNPELFSATSTSDFAQPQVDYYPETESLSAKEKAMFGPLSSSISRPFFDRARDTVDMSKFINDWLLYNLGVVEGEKRRYLAIYTSLAPASSEEDLGRHVMEQWYRDDTLDKIVSPRRPGPWSHGGSIASTLDETQIVTAQSDSPPNRKRPDLPLLRISANTSAADIVARAMQEQVSSGAPVC